MNKDVTFSLIQAISPLNIIEVNDLLPDQQTFVSIYLKLREACFLHSNETQFLSQIGKWMKLVCKVLAVVSDLSKILNEESSLLLMENNDNHWNILLSCLIQIQLDKKRRTIEGFNSLLSKEWLYLIGLRNTSKLDHNKLPNQILFTLFLDCVYQMLYQNSTEFEFTSLYLIRCFDLSFLPYAAFVKLNSKSEQQLEINKQQAIKHSPIKQSASVQFSKLTSTNLTSTPNFNLSFYHNSHSSNSLSPILKNLTLSQTLFYFNPFYDRKQSLSNLKTSSSILAAQIWRPLYLRWSEPFRNLNYYNQFLLSEYIYFKELVEKNSGFKQQIVQLDDKSDNSSINNSINNSLNNDVSSNDLEDSFDHF